MKNIIQLIRPKDWAKNLFLFVPLFFSGAFFDLEKLCQVSIGFICFSLVASCIYIINDYRDIEDDKKHPVKKYRPLASGAVHKTTAIAIALIFLLAGFSISWFLRDKFMFVLGIYFLLNVAYSFGLKNIPILDIFIISIGFVLRIKGGSVLTYIPLSEWIVIMVFLLALFLAFAKRRDDVLLKLSSGDDMRKAV